MSKLGNQEERKIGKYIANFLEALVVRQLLFKGDSGDHSVGTVLGIGSYKAAHLQKKKEECK